MNRPTAIQLHVADNVATATTDADRGETVEVHGPCDAFRRVIAREPVPFGHKIALTAVASDAPVVKYGEVIGSATRAIQPGDHVHVHNVVGNRGRT
jgi:altronate dehydratase